MTPSTCRSAWYRRIVILAAVLLIASVIAWTTRPAVAQPSYCTPDPREPVVGCWRSSERDEFPRGDSFDVFTKDGQWFEFRVTAGLPSGLAENGRVGFWRRSPDVPNEFDTQQWNTLGQLNPPDKHFIKQFSFEKNRLYTIDHRFSFNPFSASTPSYWERLGGSFSASSDSLGTAADRLIDAINGDHFAQAARAFYDFGKKCLTDKQCRDGLRQSFNIEKWIELQLYLDQAVFIGEEIAIIKFAKGPIGSTLIRLAKLQSRGIPQATAPRTPQEMLMPGGIPIGKPNGGDQTIRNVPGGEAAAESFYNQLSQGGTPANYPNYPGQAVNLPGGGFVGFRTGSSSTSGVPAIDVNIPGININKIHFPP